MVTNIVINTDEPSIGRDQNDFLHYTAHHNQHAGSDSDSNFDFSSDYDVWYDKIFHGDHPVARLAEITSAFKGKCKLALCKAGVLKPKVELDYSTGKCNACGGMEPVSSPFSAIEMAAAAGCPSCNILMQGTKKYMPRRRDLWGSKLILTESWNSGCAGRQFIRTSNRTADMSGAMGVMAELDGTMDIKNIFTKYKEVSSEVVVEFNFFGVEDDPASWDQVGLAHHISGDTSSDAAFRWFEDRLSHCLRGHPLCKTPNSNGRLPTRVLDLGPLPGASPDPGANIKLVESKGVRGRYVCLSYCWGGTIDMQLTKNRYRHYKEGITWATLPQGYRDVIHLTRRLGVRYLWIDSLCIIQDDADDWKKQASEMASVYQGAHVTIAATKARSPNESYFSVSPPEYKATRLYYRGAHDKVYHAYVRRTIPHFFPSTSSGEPEWTTDRPPLLGRGWVFQERLLSPRILHLGTVEMAWECNEVCACECMGETQTYASEPRWAHTKGSHARNLAAAADEKDVQPEWRSTVENYTRTRLTFDKDVFPAISGVVKNMQRYRSDRYLAGVWEASILDDLAWLARDSLLPRPKSWLAPTWSWASITSPISYFNYRTVLSDKYIGKVEPHTQRTVLIEASVTPAGSDETAEVCYGQITLSGPLIAARLECPEEDKDIGHYYAARHGSTLIEFAPDYDLSAPGPSHIPAGSVVYLLFLCREPELETSVTPEAKTRVFSLVLRRVDDGGSDGSSSSSSQQNSDDGIIEVPGDGTYERIGIIIGTLQNPDSRDYVEKNGVECVVKLV